LGEFPHKNSPGPLAGKQYLINGPGLFLWFTGLHAVMGLYEKPRPEIAVVCAPGDAE